MNSKRGVPILIGLIILGIFLFLRPITVSFHHIGSISILDIFGVIISYLIFFGLLLNINRLRLDLTSLLIIFFSFYCLISLVWGSSYRDIFRMVLPFLPFFLTKTIVQDRKSATVMLEVLAWGYLVPVLGSIALILFGLSDVTISGSMVERQSGLSSGVHTQGHLMLFFSYSFALYCLVEKEKKYIKFIMFTLFIGTLFCVLKTYTRTVILGGAIFWFGHLFYWKRKLFFLLLIFSVVIIFWKSDDIKKVATQEEAISQSRGGDLNAASSGRFWIWEHNLKLFADLPLTTKLMGVGLGNELKSVPGKAHKRWAGSHNDYLSLLITTGVIGVLLYLMIYGSVLLSLLLSFTVARELRLFGVFMIIAVMVMNFVSNSYIVRFQMAQLFWFLVGLIYALCTLKNSPCSADNGGEDIVSSYPKII